MSEYSKIMQALEVIKDNVDSTKKDTSKLITKTNDITNTLEEVKTGQALLNEKYEELQQEVETLRNQLKRIEHQKRSKNIVLFKVEESASEQILLTVSRVMSNAKIEVPDVCIETAYRVGKTKGGPVIIKLTAPRWKQHFFSKAANLRQLGITISNDYTLEERQERKQQWEACKQLKERGLAPTLNRNRIYVDNKQIEIADLEKLLKKPTILEAPSTPKNPQTHYKNTNSTIKKLRTKVRSESMSDTFSDKQIDQYFRTGAPSTGVSTRSSQSKQ